MSWEVYVWQEIDRVPRSGDFKELSWDEVSKGS